MQEQSVKDLVANLRQIRETKGEEAYAQAWKSLPHTEQNLVLNALGQDRKKYSIGILGIIPIRDWTWLVCTLDKTCHCR